MMRMSEGMDLSVKRRARDYRLLGRSSGEEDECLIERAGGEVGSQANIGKSIISSGGFA